MDKNVLNFIEEFKKAWIGHEFVRLILTNPLAEADAVTRIQLRQVKIKGQEKVSFVFEYPNKQEVKNFSLLESVARLTSFIGNNFKNAHLYATCREVQLSYSRKMKSRLTIHNRVCTSDILSGHDKVKIRLLNLEGNQYLKELGVITDAFQIVQSMQKKFKQISKYIETVDAIFKSSDLFEKKDISVIDMGSGKGYLTFAVYDFLRGHHDKNVEITGVELREELVDFCNQVARKCGFESLKFCRGEISSYEVGHVDMLIALHACDTATDDAIFKGISAAASIIITAPCCHKQIRKELHVDKNLKCIVKYGILAERQAEIVTDTLRGLILEAYGYKTNIFEFIADAHTHKNVMIVGVKRKNFKGKELFFDQITALKSLFGVEHFYLEKLLARNKVGR